MLRLHARIRVKNARDSGDLVASTPQIFQACYALPDRTLAGYTEDLNKRRSTGGYVFLMTDCAVS
jgi:hypothetical protein